MSNVVGQSPAEPHRVRLFESYGRRDASDLAERLRADLEARGYEVWQDLQVNMTGSDWAEVIEKGIRGSDTVIAILSPHATRRGSDADNPDDADSTCLDEIAFARFGQPPRPIIPVMGIPCQPPLPIYRLDYVDLTGWKDSDDVYRRGLDRLCAGITGALEGRTSYRDLVVSLEPLDFAAFLNEKRDRFVGREWLFAEVDTWRHNDGERALLITGDPGAGKSAFVAELVYRNPDGQVVAYHCCQADVPLHLAPGPFVRSVATMLSTQLPAYAAAVERGRAREVLAGADADPETAFELGVIEPVAILPVPEGPAKYILIDGLDEAILRSGDGRRTIVDLLQTRIDRLPPWLRVVATTRHEDAVLERFLGVRTLAIPPEDERNHRDIEAYVRSCLASPELSSMMAEQGADLDESVAQICALSAGSFVYAKQALSCLRSGTFSFDDVARQPPGLAKLYLEFFGRTFPDEASYAPARRVLAVLLAARRAMTVEQLAAVTGATPVNVRPLLSPLSGYLSVIDGHLSLFHKSLVEWLTDATAGSHRFLVDCADGERALLNYCARWATLDDDYPLHEFPAHLVRAHDLEGLEAILLNEQFATRRRRAGIHTSVDLEDFRVFAATLLEDNREVEVAALALTSNVQRRDGVAAALRDAGADSDAAARRIVRLLLKPTSHRSAGEPTPEELSGRLVAVRTAAARGYREELVDAARDSSPVVRGGLVPELYHFWSTRPEERWNLLADLGRHFSGRFGMPREEMVEIIGGLATAIVAQEFDDAATMDRLGIYCRDLIASTVGSPVTKAISRRAVLKVGVRALDRLLRNQPDYQPVNLKEINRCYPLSADVRQRVSSIVTTLEEPDRGYGSVVDALMGGEQPYDILLMVAAERALIFHGSRDPGGVVSAVGRVYADGFSWFGQSCLYVLSKILETCPLPVAEDGWLESYAAIAADFVKKTGATLVTPIATYEVSPPLAGIEVVFERHRPSGRARFLPGYLRLAAAAGDVALARRVIKAAELLSLLGHPFTALDALREVAAEGNPDLDGALVDALANVRLYQDVAVDRFLTTLGRPELALQVQIAAPTLGANEFPTMIDFFVNHQLITSDAARLEISGALRRAADASSAAELLHGIVAWVTGLMAGPEAR